jgi:carboxymethylenebutenolidase
MLPNHELFFSNHGNDISVAPGCARNFSGSDAIIGHAQLWEQVMISFPVDERTGSGYLALPTSGHGPGVILLHAWWGLTPLFISLCQRLAEHGFTVLAPDLYQGATATTIANAKKLRSQVDRDAAHAHMRAAVRYLQDHPAVDRPRLGAIGFSLGAHWALWLADQHPHDIHAVVLFYGTGGGRFRKTQSSFLGHFAEDDAWGASGQAVQALEERLQAAGRDVTFYTYPNTQHWFAEEDRPDAYREEPARIAWERTIAFLQARLA